MLINACLVDYFIENIKPMSIAYESLAQIKRLFFVVTCE